MTVRPIENIYEIGETVLEPFDQDREEVVNQEGYNKGEADKDDDEAISLEEEEGMKVRRRKMERAPTKVAAHMVNHILFRS